MDVSRISKGETVAVCDTPQTRAMIQSDQLIVANSLLSDCRECQFEKQDDSSDCETEWSEEDHEGSEMSSENRELWESFLDTSDRYNPLQFFIKVKASENDHETEEKEVESVPRSLQVKDIPECSEEEDSDWSEEEDSDWSEEEDSDWSEEEDSEMTAENRDLWESFLNNSDPYNPLHVSCFTKVKTSDNEHDDGKEVAPVCPGSQMKDYTEWSEKAESDWSNKGLSETEDLNSDTDNQLHVSCPTKVKLKAPLRPTASEVEERPGRSAKKVRFSEQVTVHTLQAWDDESRAARDGSCWVEMARDRVRFKRRVNQAEKIISACLTAQHRAKVLDSLLNHSESSLVVTDCQKTLLPFILAAIFLQLLYCTAVVFASIH